jgi:hypothetical protein
MFAMAFCATRFKTLKSTGVGVVSGVGPDTRVAFCE